MKTFLSSCVMFAMFVDVEFSPQRAEREDSLLSDGNLGLVVQGIECVLVL